MTVHPRPAALIFAEMRSLAFEARCLLEEHKHCDDPARRRALLSRHIAAQQRWDELFSLHAASTLDESRAIWQVGRHWRAVYLPKRLEGSPRYGQEPLFDIAFAPYNESWRRV